MQKFQEEDRALFEAIEEYRNGNQDKATFIYESTKKYAYKVVHQEVERYKSQSILTGDEISVTEDIMQDLYIEFFNKIEKFRNEDPRSIFKWISVVSHRMLLDYVDKNKMEVLQFEKNEDYREDNDIWDSLEINDADLESNHELLPEAALEDKEFRQLILNFVQSLPDAQAQTILLHFRGGMKYQEIADEMGVSLITVKTRMKKAKDSLEDIITKYEKKTGTKLYSVSVWPMLLLLYRISAENTTIPQNVDVKVKHALVERGKTHLLKSTNKKGSIINAIRKYTNSRNIGAFIVLVVTVHMILCFTHFVQQPRDEADENSQQEEVVADDVIEQQDLKQESEVVDNKDGSIVDTESEKKEQTDEKQNKEEQASNTEDNTTNSTTNNTPNNSTNNTTNSTTNNGGNNTTVTPEQPSEEETTTTTHVLKWNGKTTDISSEVYILDSEAANGWLISDSVLKTIGFSRRWNNGVPIYSYEDANGRLEVQFNFGTNTYIVGQLEKEYKMNFVNSNGKYYVHPEVVTKILMNHGSVTNAGWDSGSFEGTTVSTPYTATWK